MIIDLDGLSDERLKELKSILDTENKVFMYFLSPSGNGYKVVYKFQEPITEYEKYNDNYVHYAYELW